MSHEIEQYGDTTSLHKYYEMNLTRDKRGLWSGTQVYHLHKDQLAAKSPANGSAHPDYNWIFLESMNVTGEEGDWLRLDCAYAGLESTADEDEPDAVYTLDLALSEEPLETHPRYVDGLSVADIANAVTLAKSPPKNADGTLVDVDTAGWDQLKIDLYENIRKGFDKYRDPKVTWTKSWVSKYRPRNLNDIGEISEPDGNEPTAASGRNWLFVGLTSVERGQVFENQEVHELSGRGGWDEVHYT